MRESIFFLYSKMHKRIKKEDFIYKEPNKNIESILRKMMLLKNIHKISINNVLKKLNDNNIYTYKDLIKKSIKIYNHDNNSREGFLFSIPKENSLKQKEYKIYYTKQKDHILNQNSQPDIYILEFEIADLI